MTPQPTESCAPGERPARSPGPVASPGPPPCPEDGQPGAWAPAAAPAASSPSPQADPDLEPRAESPGDTELRPNAELQPGAESSRRPESNNRRMLPRSEVPKAPTPLLQRLKAWLDLILVADVFLVIAAALWFALAVLLHSRGVEAPLRLFQTLWEPLFTPAIGLLMAAALLSGALGWWQRRGQR